MLFVDENKNQYKEYLEFEKASIDLQDDVTMSIADLTVSEAQSIASYHNIDVSQLPKLLLVHRTYHKIDKHILQSEITEENIKNFFQDYQQGLLDQHMKSEEIPS